VITSIVGKIEDKLGLLNDNGIYTVADLAMADIANVATILSVATSVATRYVHRAGVLLLQLQSELEYRNSVAQTLSSLNMEILKAVSYSMLDGDMAMTMADTSRFKNLRHLILAIETNNVPVEITDLEIASAIGEIESTTGVDPTEIYSDDDIFILDTSWMSGVSLESEGSIYDVIVCNAGTENDNASIAMLWRHYLKKSGRGLVYVNTLTDQGYYPGFERLDLVYCGQQLVMNEAETHYVVDEENQLTTTYNGNDYAIYRLLT